MSTLIPGGLFVTADEAAWLVRTEAERGPENGPTPAGLLATLRKAAAGASNPPRSTGSVWLEYQRRVLGNLPLRRSPRSGPLPRSAFTDGGQ